MEISFTDATQIKVRENMDNECGIECCWQNTMLDVCGMRSAVDGEKDEHDRRTIERSSRVGAEGTQPI